MPPKFSRTEILSSPDGLDIRACYIGDTEALTAGELNGRQFVVFEHYDLRGQEPGDPGYGVGMGRDQWVWDVHRIFWDGRNSIHVSDSLRGENTLGLVALAVQHRVDFSTEWVKSELEEAFLYMRLPNDEEQRELDRIKELVK